MTLIANITTVLTYKEETSAVCVCDSPHPGPRLPLSTGTTLGFSAVLLGTCPS